MKKINQMEPWIGEEERNAVIKYLDSGGWLTEYKETEKFENEFKEFVGSKYASAVTNGTMSLVASLLTLNLKTSDEVIVPNFTQIVSANSVILAGGKPILSEIDPSNVCLDINLLESIITENTRAIIYVNINGRSHDMFKLKKIIDENNLVLIEDSSQSLGCYNNSKHLGTFGKLGTFSLSPAKIITTGQGGLIVTDDHETFRNIEMLKDYGRPTSGIDSCEIIGYNFKFTDLQAVIGLEQMKKLPWRIARKKEMYKQYRAELEGLDAVSFLETDLNITAPWFIDIFVDQKIRSKLIAHLSSNNIGVRPFYPSINMQKPYAKIKGNFDLSEKMSKSGLWLPSSLFLTDDDIRLVCKQIKNFFNN